MVKRYCLLIMKKSRLMDLAKISIMFSPALLNGPRHAKTCLRAYADMEGTDQTAHPRSLIRAFAVPYRIIGYYRMY